MTQLLSKRQVADTLGVSLRTLDRVRAAGELRSVKVRGRVLFDAEDLKGFIDRLRQSPSLLIPAPPEWNEGKDNAMPESRIS